MPRSLPCPSCNRPMMHTCKLNREWHSCAVCDAPENPAEKPDIIMLMRQAEEFYAQITQAAAAIGRPRK